MALKPLDRIPQSSPSHPAGAHHFHAHRPLHCGDEPGCDFRSARPDGASVGRRDEKQRPFTRAAGDRTPSGNQEQSLSTYRLYLLDKDGNVLYSLKSEDSEQFSEPVLQGWTEEKVRKQNEEAVTVNSMGSSSDWRVLAVPIVANDTSGLSEASSSLPCR